MVLLVIMLVLQDQVVCVRAAAAGYFLFLSLFLRVGAKAKHAARNVCCDEAVRGGRGDRSWRRPATAGAR
jgi:hypothetical protein